MNEKRLEEIRLRSHRLRYDVLCLIGEVERLKQRNHLESAVVEAALAERKAWRSPTYEGASWYAAMNAYNDTVAALIAFRSEEGEVDA